MDKYAIPVAVVKRSKLFEKGEFQGFLDADLEKTILDNLEFMIRREAEVNEDYKQPIVYAIIVNKEKGLVYAYQRSSFGNYDEKRLEDKWSIGIGGHIEEEEGSMNPIKDGLLREISEEVTMNGEVTDIQVLGYINDDSNEVGRVHIGVLYAAYTDSTEIKPNDLESIRGEVISYSDLELKKDKLENWSLMALEPLNKILN